MAKTIQGQYKVELQILGAANKLELLLRILNPFYSDYEDVWLNPDQVIELRDELNAYLEVWSE